MIDDPHRALIIALTDYLGPLTEIVATTRDWSSATFTGMQHTLSFACHAPPALIDALPDVDLPMRGHFVADLRLVALDHGAPARVTIEVLTIRDE